MIAQDLHVYYMLPYYELTCLDTWTRNDILCNTLLITEFTTYVTCTSNIFCMNYVAYITRIITHNII